PILRSLACRRDRRTTSTADRTLDRWLCSPPSCSALLRLRQSRRASTYLQGNSRVDERSIGHFNGPIPLTKVSSCRRILTAWDGSWFCGRYKRLALPATPLLLLPSPLWITCRERLNFPPVHVP